MVTSITWQSEALRELPGSVPEADADQVSEKLRAVVLDTIQADRWPIYMFGPQGRGKTCAAACLYVRWPERALWYDVATAVRQVMTCRSNGAGFVTLSANGREYELTESQILNRIACHSLVVFDDVGIREPTEAQFATFYEMVNSRVGKPTIVTGNIEPNELEDVYDGRIASRLLAGTVLHVVGQDRRIENNVVVEV